MGVLTGLEREGTYVHLLTLSSEKSPVVIGTTRLYEVNYYCPMFSSIIGWKDVPVLALETVGAECFNLSVKANKLVEITLTSIAKTLGARSVTPQLLEKYKDFNVISEVLPDKDAVHGCVRFAGIIFVKVIQVLIVFMNDQFLK